jgi:hypothetical protein
MNQICLKHPSELGHGESSHPNTLIGLRLRFGVRKPAGLDKEHAFCQKSGARIKIENRFDDSGPVTSFFK